MNSLLQHLEIILEQNQLTKLTKLTTVNSKFQEILAMFATRSLETTFTTDRACSTELEEIIVVVLGGAKNLVTIPTENHCEEMVHPHLSPT